MKTFKLYANTGQNSKDLYYWSSCYLHGEAMDVVGADTDVLLANKPMPKHPGSYAATVDGVPAVIVLDMRFNMYISGRVALLHDFEGLQHVVESRIWK